ncbi:MAG: AbrB/MazE/SpoVT family DNA-binding domain-containing protein [Promethearchaeia archaeon]
MEIKTAKMSTKGQLTIPKEFRDKLNLQAGDEVIVHYQAGELVIKPKMKNLKILRGLLKEDINLEKVSDFLSNESKKWRL